ncbi:PREDICTED: zinc finger protein 277-like [Tauraco erythrolophus]|uniref:zinc finger protein 277-like n=1 Tax=Tauraco erythrolophus TaxID=121530 RepID=UPI0005233642|nr:PREDICTED: zinc finger protein 277-like [Tauraco erythrolophus]
MDEKLESSSEIYALAHAAFLEYSLARFTPCVFTNVTLYKVQALTGVASQLKSQEFGKSWEEVQSEDDRELLDNLEEDWSDWEEHPVCAVCLFCEQQADTTEKLYLHMQKSHGFDFPKMKSEHGLNFYQQVKLVNFIRREIHHRRCYNCQEKFQSKGGLISHMEETKHITFLPARSTWDQPQYYFPTYENDTLLCTLSDSEDLITDDQSEDVPVISEDVSNLEALKQSSVLNQLLHEENKSQEKF